MKSVRDNIKYRLYYSSGNYNKLLLICTINVPVESIANNSHYNNTYNEKFGLVRNKNNLRVDILRISPSIYVMNCF